jgi:uncharacterized protein (DUF736 family)
MADGKLVTVGNGWKKQTKKGEDYLSLALTLDGKPYKLMLFKNTKKTDAKSPDFRAVMSGEGSASAPAYTPRAPQTPAPAKEESPW